MTEMGTSHLIPQMILDPFRENYCHPGVLWTVAPSLVLFLFVYAAVGTWLTTSVFGKRLMQLQYMVLQKEGDLRFDLVRTRENSGVPLLREAGT